MVAICSKCGNDIDTLENPNAEHDKRCPYINYPKLTNLRQELCKMSNDVYFIYQTTNEVSQEQFSIITKKILSAMDECDKVIYKK